MSAEFEYVVLQDKRQYPCVILAARYCSLFRESVNCIYVCLSDDRKAVIDVAAVPSDALQISHAFRRAATAYAENLKVSLYIEELV